MKRQVHIAIEFLMAILATISLPSVDMFGHPQGVWVGQSGDMYVGDVKYGVQDGEGVFHFANGDRWCTRLE